MTVKRNAYTRLQERLIPQHGTLDFAAPMVLANKLLSEAGRRQIMTRDGTRVAAAEDGIDVVEPRSTDKFRRRFRSIRHVCRHEKLARRQNLV